MFCMKPRFEKEAEDNSEMAYYYLDTKSRANIWWETMHWELWIKLYFWGIHNILGMIHV